MSKYVSAFLAPYVALLHWITGTPKANARTALQDAVRAMYRAEAEVTYHDKLIEHFDSEARTMDPHADWHLFAQLKDKWAEHLDEHKREHRRHCQTRAKVEACKARLAKLEKTS